MSFRKRSLFNHMGPYLGSYLVLGFTVPALLYTMIMVMLGWRHPAIGATASVSFFSPREARVYLYQSPSTFDHFARVGGNYENLLGPWLQYFNERGRAFKIAKGADEIQTLTKGVLVLPSAVALSDAERAAIVAFRGRGGSVLATWASGTRNERGEWLGWTFLEQLGARDIVEMPATEENRHLVLLGESTVSHTQGAGQRVWMGKNAEPLLRMKGQHVAARFMNWARVPDDGGLAEGAVIFAEENRKSSRAVVFGFPESAWEARPLVTQLLIDDALRWLLHDVAVIRSAWPDGKRAAQVIEMDTEEGFPNAVNFAAMMRASGIPATFFALTSVAKNNAQVLNELAAGFEIAYHGDVHIGFKGLDPAVQRKRIADMRSELASVYPGAATAVGFRAPTEGYDQNTEMALLAAGIRYHAADPGRSDARLPLFAKLNDAPASEDLVVLPRTQRDDLNLSASNLSPEQTRQALISDFNHAAESGALGWLSVHSQNFSADSTLAQAFPEFLQHARKQQKSVWLANGRQVADWWRDRERFRADYSFDGRRLDLSVTVMGDKPVKGASLVVMLPARRMLPSVRAAKIGISMPDVVALDEFRALLQFQSLKPGHYNYVVTFDNH